MTVHHRRIKYATLVFGDSPTEQDFGCQVKSWNFVNNTADGDKQFSQCYDPDDTAAGEFREEVDPDWTFEAEFFADWRSNGVSVWAQEHDGEVVTLTVDHHPDIADEHVQVIARVKVKAPSIGGEARSGTEMTSASWVCIGKPTFLGPDEVS